MANNLKYIKINLIYFKIMSKKDIENTKNILFEASKGLEMLAKKYGNDEFNGYSDFVKNNVVSKNYDFIWKMLFSDDFK